MVVYRIRCNRLSSVGTWNTVIGAFSLGVEKRVYGFFGSKGSGVCNSFSHTKLTDQLESRHVLSTQGPNASNVYTVRT